MEALVVSVRLRNGYAASDPWSPDLAGILAYWRLRERLGEEEFALGMTGHRALVTPDDLPLAVERDGGHWWYCCSSPIVDVALRYHRWYHRRFDLAPAIDRVDPKVKRVLTAGGAYKAYRNRETVIVPADGVVRWHVIGDAAEIRRLLRRCRQIGRGIDRGNGWVMGAWSVEPGGDERLARFHRPLPVAYATAHGIGGTVLEWGTVPPGRRPEHRTLCVMPEVGDAAR